MSRNIHDYTNSKRFIGVDNLDTTALIIAIIFFIAGLLGTILPILPGPALIYCGMILYGLLNNFQSLNLYFFIIQAIALIVIFAADYVASAVGTILAGGSNQAAVGAILGTVIAMLILGPMGIIIGPFLGAVIVELFRGLGLKRAINVGLFTLVGTLGGTLFKLSAEFIMIVYFFIEII